MESTTDKKPNRLIYESSPYLLQHAYNPVDWYAWGKEALEKAKTENKPILVSIGYAACHWCHVMEHECFSKSDIAEIMNQYFVNIKVDREERPDIDQIYMDALHAMGLQGGWPLNVFLTPDAKPFYGGTYFPPAHWKHILNQIHKAFLNDRIKIEQSAEAFFSSLNISEIKKYGMTSAETSFSKDKLKSMYVHLKKNFDREMGGTKKAPKFPMPSVYRFLLRYYYVTHDKDALQHTELTLQKMAMGGLYDHIRGGFARYSTDEWWFVPHFEKMLYDNAQLITLYSEAYQITQNELYKNVVYETVDWMLREMTNEDHAFYSAIDADSEHEEGKYYVWTYDEIENLLHDDITLFAEFYNLRREGNWEHRNNILIKKYSDEDFAQLTSISAEELKQKNKKWKAILMNAQNKRVRPATDDKILCSWNALAIYALVKAYQTFGEKKFIDTAINAALFVQQHMISKNMLYHSFKSGKPYIHGFLEDYASAIQAFIILYETTFDEQWITLAQSLTEYTLENFFDPEEGMFYFTDIHGEKLIARKKEIFDNVIPASNSMMAQNLWRLGKIMYNEKWVNIALSMLSKTEKILITDVYYMSNWACLYCDNIIPAAEIAIVGHDVYKYSTQLHKLYFPNAIICGSRQGSNSIPALKNKNAHGDKTMIYVCQDKVCKNPTDNLEEALMQIQHLNAN